MIPRIENKLSQVGQSQHQINKGNIPYYKKFDEYKHVHIGDEIDVDIKHLSKQNTNIIKYVCDNCGEEKETTYKNYCDPRRDKTSDLCKGECANVKRENTNKKLSLYKELN